MVKIIGFQNIKLVFISRLDNVAVCYRNFRKQCDLDKLIMAYYSIKKKNINNSMRVIYGRELKAIFGEMDKLFKQIDKNGIDKSIYDEMMRYEVDITAPLLKRKNIPGIYTDKDRKCLVDITKRPIRELMIFPKLYYSIIETKKKFYYLLFTVKNNNLIILEFGESSEAKISTTIESYQIGALELRGLIDRLPDKIAESILYNIKEKASKRWIEDFNIVYGD